MGEIDRLVEVSRVPRSDIEALGELDDSHYTVLRTAFEGARDRREQELNAAIENGLTWVPRLLRPVMRRILFS
ncbi:hypothetical protein GPX89_15330 [Nocardia sp. ET3-3]|uniref:Uncharacterized protein n=1 Tax=Nocardia terrae TaxID=2675851 RepID=A0A7K1UW62_9NOCA|nr:hypothetical protein [Nocardia terrae]MVU78614.1 hypothetical protein [Nocardia terrae]